MINKSEVLAFFDERADRWDGMNEHDPALIGDILDLADVRADRHVLDVACGTGVLIPFYLSRGVSSVTAIDLSPRMIARAKEKYPRGVTFIAGEAESFSYGRLFDCIVIYNALPHFESAERLIAHLARFLAPGGTLTVAHGQSARAIDLRHKQAAPGVSSPLPRIDDLSVLVGRFLTVNHAVSDDRFYLLTAQKPFGPSGSDLSRKVKK